MTKEETKKNTQTGLEKLISLLEAKVDDESINSSEMRVLADLYHRNGVELGLKNVEDNASVPNILPFGEEKQANG